MVPNLISIVPESTLNIFPLLMVCCGFVLGYAVVFFWRMPEETTCSSSVLPEPDWEFERGVSPSFPSLCLRKSLDFPSSGKEEAQKPWGGRTKRSGEEPTHSPSSEQARSPTT